MDENFGWREGQSSINKIVCENSKEYVEGIRWECGGDGRRWRVHRRRQRSMAPGNFVADLVGLKKSGEIGRAGSPCSVVSLS